MVEAGVALWGLGLTGEDLAQVARDLGVGWSTVISAERYYGQPLVDDPDRIGDIEVLGTDETSFLPANQFHHALYVTGFVDLCAIVFSLAPERTSGSSTLTPRPSLLVVDF